MTIILLVLSALINGDNKQFNDFVRLVAIILGIVYDILILSRLIF